MRTKARVGSSTRMRRLRAALALKDETLENWSRSLNVSPMHTYFVLRGSRSSPRIEQAADELADQMGVPNAEQLEILLQTPQPPQEPANARESETDAASAGAGDNDRGAE